MDEIDAVNQLTKESLQQAKKRGLEESYLLMADELNAPALKKLLERKVNPNAKDSSGGALFRVLNRADESQEMLECLAIILQHKDVNPNGVGNHHSPLKVAVSRGHKAAIRLLLAHPKIKLEIHPAGMTCAQLDYLPQSVMLTHDENTKEECVLMHPNYVGKKSSPGTASESLQSPSRTKPVINKMPTEQNDGRNPFQAPVRGRLPPPDAIVMNPGSFDNIVEATRYYFFGAPWLGWQNTVMWVFVIGQCCVAGCVFYLAGKQHQLPPVEAPHRNAEVAVEHGARIPE